MKIVLLETANGKLYIPDTDDCLHSWLSMSGRSHEDHFIREVCALLDERPRGVAIDAGANFGTWTLPLARHAKRVIAYEAQPDVCDLLYRTCCENNLGNVSVCNRALWSCKTILTVPRIDMGPDGDFKYFGGLQVSPRPPAADGQSALAVTLDEEIHDRVSFIKIDVEGSESEVIKGGRHLISRDKPIMFVEVAHPNTDTDGLIQQIKDFGYSVTRRGMTPENVLAMPI
jgi:FkbM family methyltransferase